MSVTTMSTTRAAKHPSLPDRSAPSAPSAVSTAIFLFPIPARTPHRPPAAPALPRARQWREPRRVRRLSLPISGKTGSETRTDAPCPVAFFTKSRRRVLKQFRSRCLTPARFPFRRASSYKRIENPVSILHAGAAIHNFRHMPVPLRSANPNIAGVAVSRIASTALFRMFRNTCCSWWHSPRLPANLCPGPGGCEYC